MNTGDTAQQLLQAFLSSLHLLLDGDLEVELDRWSAKNWTWEEYVQELALGLSMRDRLQIWQCEFPEYTILLMAKELGGACYSRIIVLKKSLPLGILLIPQNDTTELFPNFPLDDEDARRLQVGRVITLTELDCHGNTPSQRLRLRNPHYAERNITVLPVAG